MSPAEQFRALEAGKIDLGFVGLHPPTDVSGLQWESIARLRTVVVLPANHPLAHKRHVRLADLESQFFVGMSEKNAPGLSQLAGCHLSARGLFPPRAAGCRSGTRPDDFCC